MDNAPGAPEGIEEVDDTDPGLTRKALVILGELLTFLGKI